MTKNINPNKHYIENEKKKNTMAKPIARSLATEGLILNTKVRPMNKVVIRVFVKNAGFD